MAYDTLTINSPFINIKAAEMIKKKCIKRSGIDLNTGEIIYEITTGSLEGSHDSRISIQIKDYKWEKCAFGVPKKIPCDNYLTVEVSIHKLIVGHNIFGGFDYYQYCVRYIVKFIETILDISLPDWQSWEAKRIDYAYNFDLGSNNGVKAYIRDLYQVSFPRRKEKISLYGNTGISVPGSTTTVKFYHKGSEFKKHDYIRLAKCGNMNINDLNNLQSKADNILRVEVEIHKKKLESLFNNLSVLSINDEIIKNVYEMEVNKLINIKSADMDIVFNSQDVSIRLFNIYSKNKARSLLGTWHNLSIHGKEFTKSTMSLRTYYDHLKCLIDANISWTGTDVVLLSDNEQIYPLNFQPIPSSPYQIENNCSKSIVKLLAA